MCRTDHFHCFYLIRQSVSTHTCSLSLIHRNDLSLIHHLYPTHTNELSLYMSLTDTHPYLSLSHTNTLTRPLSHPHSISHTHTLSLSDTHTSTLSFSLKHTRSLIIYHTHSLSDTHNLSLSHKHTHRTCGLLTHDALSRTDPPAAIFLSL